MDKGRIQKGWTNDLQNKSSAKLETPSGITRLGFTRRSFHPPCPLSLSFSLPLTLPFSRSPFFRSLESWRRALSNERGDSILMPLRIRALLTSIWDARSRILQEWLVLFLSLLRKTERERDFTLESVFCIFWSSRVSRGLEICSRSFFK